MKIGVFTSARSEYGLLKNIIKKIDDTPELELILFVSGAHLSEKYGYTVKEIIKDGNTKFFEIPFLEDSTDKNDLSKGIGIGIAKLSEIVTTVKPDLFLLLGDRYDLLIPVTVAVINNIPLVHLHGGEITEGAIDEQIRHAITKFSHIHLPATEEYAENISKMGEEDWRIQIAGSPGIENIKTIKHYTIEEIYNKIQVSLDKPTFLCTFHPVTLENNLTIEEQLSELFISLNKYPEYQIIFTAPGADADSIKIIEMIKNYCETRKNSYFFSSLGVELYLNVMQFCSLVIGNSSSGIIETPSFHIPTVNIGDRQKNRTASKSVIHCKNKNEDISLAIQKAISKEFIEEIKHTKNPYDPYDDTEVSQRVINILKNIKINEKLLRKKLDFNVNKEEWNKLMG